MCLVTIGLPVYNAAPFLADAIQSVLNQTLTDWELLIVDDGSTDSSMAVAESFTDPRIRLLTDGINRGLPARLNQISRLANGTYLARMDADDLMTPDRLQTQFDCMIASPGIDLVGAFAYVIDTRNQVQGIRGTTTLPTTGRRAAGGVALMHPTVLARTDWFRRHPYRENCRRAEDYDLWLRTVETSVFYVIDQPLLFYREAGLPLRRKYSETAADVRKILCRLPRTTLSVGRFWQLLCLSYSKEIVYGLFALTGRIDWLMQRRNRPLTVAERHQAQAVLSQSVQSVVTHKIDPLMRRTLLMQVFTVPESLVFIDGQPAFLRLHGYDMHVVCAGGDAADVFAEQQRVPYHAVPFTRHVTPMQDLLALRQTYRLFRCIRPDIVHGNTPKAGLIGMLAAWLARVPVRIYELHGFPFESRRGLARAGLIALDRLACRLATQVLAVSKSLLERAVVEGMVPRANISVLHHGSCNGVDAGQRFNPARLDHQKLAELKTNLNLSGRVIGFVGRLTRDKGVYELLHAWVSIRVAYPDVTLLLAGQSESDFLDQRLIQDDDRIRAVGHVTDMPYYYALMDFLVLPTYREGFGNVLIEAAAMERPAVVSRVTGAVDAVVGGETGLFCEPRSVDSLTRQLQAYLDAPTLVEQHGKNARQRVLTDFGPSDVWMAKRQLYEQLLAKTRSADRIAAL